MGNKDAVLLGSPRRIGVTRPYYLLVNVLRTLWVAVVYHSELGIFRAHVSRCSWPDVTSPLKSDVNSDEWARLANVLVIADPQIFNMESYPGRSPWLMRLTQIIVDLNMRKSWRALLRLQPDMAIFLGDMLDNGRAIMSDPEYTEYHDRFRDIFVPPAGKQLPMYYLPGNHDIGLGTSSQFADNATQRYQTKFGQLNQLVELYGHILVLINAPGLVEEEYQRTQSGLNYAHWVATNPNGNIAFVHSISSYAKQHPAVLLTHIPLARPEGADCGPLRERGTIRRGWGRGYQNTLPLQISEFLLTSTHPSLVLSGDDHDYCEYTHTYDSSDGINEISSKSVTEITVKSFSMAMGVRKPGVQLLSLASPSYTTSTPHTNSPSATPCILPDQLGIYLQTYIPFLLLSLLLLLASNIHRVYTRGRYAKWVPLTLPKWLSDRVTGNGILLRGHRVRLTLPWAGRKDEDEDEGALWPVASSKRRAGEHSGAMSGWLWDVLRVGWIALFCFVAINWWVI
ncbi:hypothetical protein WOLCODRAFT_104481 [Wolfiporia cocos MD-104 SS10]|uniref:Calcineurin-like phosphoesterase domain-containing protein n=1 Tax=Wolfiporia cocos (strain MD-104) TaxID=742152 RepID=A0A2H3JR35_WOLCO|nr:hypothetical protein WOLCODRAFT_104481 [Wolfiporia cocos MD-104 SS10]